MSLKWFHVFFIATAIVLSVGVAAWALTNAEWLLAAASLACGTMLVVYRGAFLRKMRALG